MARFHCFFGSLCGGHSIEPSERFFLPICDRPKMPKTFPIIISRFSRKCSSAITSWISSTKGWRNTSLYSWIGVWLLRTKRWFLIYACEPWQSQNAKKWYFIRQIPISQFSFLHTFWFHFFHQGFNWKLFICRRVLLLKFHEFFTINRIITVDRKCQKVHLFLLFSRYSISCFSKAPLPCNTACANVRPCFDKPFIIENPNLKNRTRKKRLEFFGQGLNPKPFAICSIIHFYTPLTESIAVRLHL